MSDWVAIPIETITRPTIVTTDSISICVGNEISLADEILSTTDAPQGSTYVYNLLGGTDFNNPLLTFSNAGIYKYLVRVVTPQGCESETDTIVVTVGDANAHLIGSHICIGDSTLFTVNLVSSSSLDTITQHIWYSSNAAIASVDVNSGEVTAHSEGTFTVTVHYETANGCSGELTSDIYNVYPKPVAHVKDTMVCEGITVSFSSLVTGLLNSDSYKVFASDSITELFANGITLGSTTDTIYILPISTTAHCDGTLAQVILTVSPRPTITATDTAVCAGSPIDLSGVEVTVEVDGIATSNYILRFADMAGITVPSIQTPVTATSYRVYATVAGCESEYDTINVTIKNSVIAITSPAGDAV
jgi:hypothetical protein